MVVFHQHGERSERDRHLALGRVNALFDYECIRKTPRLVLYHEHWHIVGAKYKL